MDTCFTQISVAGLAVSTATTSASPLSPELLAMDFVVFRNALLTEHGGLYRYQSEEILNHLMDSCLLSIDKPMTTLEFGKKILFITSKIMDGHTGTNISGLLVKHYVENTRPTGSLFAATKFELPNTRSSNYS